MYFSEKFKVMQTDICASGNISTSAIFRYMQTAAGSQMEKEGLTYWELYEQNKVFVASRIAMDFYEKINEFDEILVECWPTATESASFPRSYKIYKGDVLCAEGITLWALLNIKENTLLRGKDVDLSGFTFGEPIKNDNLRFVFPKTNVERVGSFKVGYDDLDINRHMNNTKYPDKLLTFVENPFDKEVKSISIHYKKEAKFDDEVSVFRFVAQENEKEIVYLRAVNGDDIICETRLVLK